MNRRDFLKLAAATPVAAALPASASTAQVPPSIAAIKAATLKALFPADRDYFAIVHPSCWLDIRRMVVRDLWALEYRDWRKTVRAGLQVETLREVMERVHLEAQGHWRRLQDWNKSGEIGRIESVRFIQTERLAA
jgi:hypothetical protein